MTEENKKLSWRDILQIVQVVLLIVLVAEVSVMLLKGPSKQSRRARRRAPRVKKVNINLQEFTKNSHFIGNQNAPVTIVKFNSFTCGFCRRAGRVMMKLSEKYSDNVKIVYKHFNRGPRDMKTAMAVECAGEQKKFWKMYNKIFEKGYRGKMATYAKEIGINVASFNACMAARKYEDKIKADSKSGRKIGVRGTPSFVINDKLHVGYRPYRYMQMLVKRELRK